MNTYVCDIIPRENVNGQNKQWTSNAKEIVEQSTLDRYGFQITENLCRKF